MEKLTWLYTQAISRITTIHTGLLELNITLMNLLFMSIGIPTPFLVPEK